MRLILLGATRFSREILENLYAHGFTVELLFTIPEEFSISYSDKKVRNYNFDPELRTVAKANKIPVLEVETTGSRLSDYRDTIQAAAPDVILVVGWYYMVPQRIRELARYGAWGIHASLLPKYAGGAPLVWAMINGEPEVGVTLFRLGDGVDDGDIIAQRAFSIDARETIREVYEKATIASKSVLTKSLEQIDQVTFTPQDKSKIEVYPQRKPADGLIDWSWDAARIGRFIRAQTRPYPGAFTVINGNKVVLWDADVEEAMDEIPGRDGNTEEM